MTASHDPSADGSQGAFRHPPGAELWATVAEALDRLAGLETSVDPAGLAPLRETLLRLRDQLGALAPPPVPETVDEGRFRRLLEIAGPDTANELVHRLHVDLKSTRERLDEAMAGTDWVEIRAQTHVLMSLAGTVGAGGLQRLSEALNAAAHQRDRDQAAGLRTELLMRLDGLLAFVAQQRDGA